MSTAQAKPVSVTHTAPGRDDPRGFIVATFVTWGDMWAWEVVYHLTSDPWHVQHAVTDFCEMPYVADLTTDLRSE